MRNDDPLNLLTISDIVAIYKIPRPTLRRLVARGIIPAIRITNKIILFDPRELNKALEALTVRLSKVR